MRLDNGIKGIRYTVEGGGANLLNKKYKNDQVFSD